LPYKEKEEKRLMHQHEDVACQYCGACPVQGLLLQGASSEDKYCQDCYDKIIEDEECNFEKYTVKIVEKTSKQSIYQFKPSKDNFTVEARPQEEKVIPRVNGRNVGSQNWPDTTILASIDGSPVFAGNESSMFIGSREEGKLISL
jgi:hypothetical protein